MLPMPCFRTTFTSTPTVSMPSAGWEDLTTAPSAKGPASPGKRGVDGGYLLGSQRLAAGGCRLAGLFWTGPTDSPRQNLTFYGFKQSGIRQVFRGMIGLFNNPRLDSG